MFLFLIFNFDIISIHRPFFVQIYQIWLYYYPSVLYTVAHPTKGHLCPIRLFLGKGPDAEGHVLNKFLCKPFKFYSEFSSDETTEFLPKFLVFSMSALLLLFVSSCWINGPTEN